MGPLSTVLTAPPPLAHREAELIATTPFTAEVAGVAVDGAALWATGAFGGVSVGGLVRLDLEDGSRDHFSLTWQVGSSRTHLVADPRWGVVVRTVVDAAFLEPGASALRYERPGSPRHIDRLWPSARGWWVVRHGTAPVEFVAGEEVEVGAEMIRAYTSQVQRDALDFAIGPWGEAARFLAPSLPVPATRSTMVLEAGNAYEVVDGAGQTLDAFAWCDDAAIAGGVVGAGDRLYRWSHDGETMRLFAL